MRKPAVVALSALAAAAAGVLAVRLATAAGSKSATIAGVLTVVVDDMTGGSTESVGMSDGTHVIDGLLGQVDNTIPGATILSVGTTDQAGFLSALAGTPVSTSLIVVAQGTIQANWTDASPPNQSGTLYEVDASTASNFSGTVFSSTTYGFTLQLSGLTQNSTYYARIKASYMNGDDSGWLNLGSIDTLSFSDTIPPGPITNLLAQPGALPAAIALSWTAPGNDNYSGNIIGGAYAVGASTDPAFSFSTTTALLQISTNTSPGAAQYYTLAGLIAGNVYYLRVWTKDQAGNWSALSNGATTQATPVPSTDIVGQVLNISTQGITGVEVDAFNSAGTQLGTTFTLADGSGTFVVSGLPPGNYQLKATWAVNGIASSVSLDSIPTGTGGVDFMLNLTYTLGSLTGQMLGQSVPAGGGGGLNVASFRPKQGGPQPFVEVYSRNRRIVQAFAQANGNWTVPNLLPGPYSVRAFNGLDYTPFTVVNLAEGQTAIVTFSFDPLPQDAVFSFPNPARSQTTIRFETALQPLEAEVSIFDIAGNLVYQIPGSQIVPAGPNLYHANWNLVNMRGESVASGVYIVMVKVKGGANNQTAKVIKKVAVVR